MTTEQLKVKTPNTLKTIDDFKIVLPVIPDYEPKNSGELDD